MNDAIEVIAASFGVLIIFLGISSPIIIAAVVYYLKKRLEHKQIIAAIEKGANLSNLKLPLKNEPTWISNLTKGIALLIIAVGFGIITLVRYMRGTDFNVHLGLSFIALVFLGIGIGRILRGILQRKGQQQIQTANENNTADNKTADL